MPINSPRAASGNTCYSFAPDHGITTDQLYAWNPVLGADGSECATKFLFNERYCVGVLVLDPDGVDGSKAGGTSA